MPISTTGREDAFRAGNGRVGGGCGVGVKGEWPQRSRELSKWHHGKRRHVHAAGLENLEVRRALGLNCVRVVAPKNENAASVITHPGTSARRRTAKNCKRQKKRRPFDAKKLHVPVRVGVVELPDGSRKHVAVAYGAPCRAPLNPCVVNTMGWKGPWRPAASAGDNRLATKSAHARSTCAACGGGDFKVAATRFTLTIGSPCEGSTQRERPVRCEVRPHVVEEEGFVKLLAQLERVVRSVAVCGVVHFL